MDRVGVLVDAGYFFAAGSALTSDAGKHRRETIIIDENRVANALKDFAHAVTGGLSLLRIYWYDGAPRNTAPTAEHGRLAHTNDIKVRLGYINSAGEQKGVDSLIVTDLVELARNRAVTDIVLLSGDEDVRIGVQLAQSYGVRVHLLGITPCVGTQSAQLRQEADTCSEWDLPIVAKLISLRAAPNVIKVTTAPAPTSIAAHVAGTAAAKANARAPQLPSSAISTDALNEVVEQVLAELVPAEVTGVAAHMRINSNNVPRELDGKLLARCRTALGSNLDDASRRYVRSRARARIRELATAGA